MHCFKADTSSAEPSYVNLGELYIALWSFISLPVLIQFGELTHWNSESAWTRKIHGHGAAQVISISVYNFSGLFLAESQTFEAYFPMGTVMAIREP